MAHFSFGANNPDDARVTIAIKADVLVGVVENNGDFERCVGLGGLSARLAEDLVERREDEGVTVDGHWCRSLEKRRNAALAAYR